MCCGCSKEPSHRDGSFEYTQHMFWLRNKKNNFQLRTLTWGLEMVLITYVGKCEFLFVCFFVCFLSLAIFFTKLKFSEVSFRMFFCFVFRSLLFFLQN